ncbi:MAG: hypothetical protein UU47_C0005G0027 [candidate division TM6 bacterium GW2011_GWE2_41_16]|nr:MAG: hypothetical protein UU47_C0005G0027 [candidate division TM6 bacterium GW2011_GWE2_41_16]
MKKHLPLVLLMSAAVGSIYAEEGDITSRSFFSVRPHFATGSFEHNALNRNDRMEAREDGYGSAWCLTAFGGRSQSASDLARYFLPFGVTKLHVKENAAVNPVDGTDTRTVDAAHLNIETVNNTFESDVTFCPRHEFFGLGLDWHQALCMRDDGTVNYYFEASAPLLQVRNNMNMRERIINDGGGAVGELGLDNAPRVGNVTEAFQQPNWNYGKILPCANSKPACSTSTSRRCGSCHPYKRTRIGDIELSVGKNMVATGCCKLDSYIGMVIPTGNRVTSRYVFEAMVGNNHHWGVMYGANAELGLFSCEDHTLKLALDTNTRFLFANHQVRSFDLKDKSWSRYMEMYQNQAQAALAATDPQDQGQSMGVSGINMLSQCVKVKPRFSTVWNATLLYNHCNFNSELGYGFYARQCEKVEFCNKNFTAALKYYTGLGQTTIYRTINGLAAGTNLSVANYQAIPTSHFDLTSATHPAMLSFILHGSLGYSWKEVCYPTFVGIGGSYEFPSGTNAALAAWTLWGKLGITF